MGLLVGNCGFRRKTMIPVKMSAMNSRTDRMMANNRATGTLCPPMNTAFLLYCSSSLASSTISCNFGSPLARS